jgi:hypothetical protein
MMLHSGKRERKMNQILLEYKDEFIQTLMNTEGCDFETSLNMYKKFNNMDHDTFAHVGEDPILDARLAAQLFLEPDVDMHSPTGIDGPSDEELAFYQGLPSVIDDQTEEHY